MRKSWIWPLLTLFVVGLAYLLSDLTDLDLKIAGVIALISGILFFLMFDFHGRHKSSDVVDQLRLKHLKQDKEDPDCQSKKRSGPN